MRLLDTLSKQTGYWPVFTFVKSMNHLIDLASVGLIGQNGVLFGAKHSRWQTRVDLDAKQLA